MSHPNLRVGAAERGDRQCLGHLGAVVAIAAVACAAARADAQAASANFAAQRNPWVEDLDALAETFRAHHPKLAIAEELARFDAGVEALKLRLPALPRAGAIVAIASLVATLHDGHTQLPLPSDPAASFHRIPLSLYLFDDGLFVRRATETDRALLGARILAIGELAAEDAISRLQPLLHGDNEISNQDILPTRLVLAEVLQAEGVIPSAGEVRLRLALRDGTVRVVRLSPRATSERLQWVDARAPGIPPPLYQQHRDETWWFTDVSELHAVYAQVNSLENAADESFDAFCGHLFVIIGRLTFSAAGQSHCGARAADAGHLRGRADRCTCESLRRNRAPRAAQERPHGALLDEVLAERQTR